MTIDFWGLGLQAVNVLILIWLLGRVFWRPVAGAIAARQEAAKSVLAKAQAAQTDADAVLAELTQARAGIADERSAILAASRTEAGEAAKATLADARTKAEAMLNAARQKVAHDTAAAERANAAAASNLSVEIAAQILTRMDGPAVQSAFLAQLVDAIGQMPAADRAALVSDATSIEVVIATDPGTARAEIEAALRVALGAEARLRFVTDPDLIAGMELRSGHFVLHNSWRADLSQIRKAVRNAA